jgi:tetratricopeptide (TPR) repeat protein
MLSEEAFLFVVLLFACGLLGLGTLELVAPTRPRHPVRQRARDPWRRARPRGVPARLSALSATSVAAPLPVAEETSFAPEAMPELVVASDAPAADPEPPSEAFPPLTVVPPIAEVTDAQEERARRPRAPTLPRPASRPLPLENVAFLDAAAPEETSESPADDLSVDERCLALFESKRFAEVVRLGEAHLEVRKSAGPLVPSVEAARETARLWGVVGLAKQGLDDLDGARFAFEEAIALAPQTERPTWERYLAALALIVAQRSLDAGVADPVRPERLESIRSAIDWLGRGLAVAPDDATLRDTLVAARDAFWLTSEEIVKALVKRKDFAEARRRLDGAMMDPECPPERQRAFRALWGRTMGGEVGQTTAEAIRHMQKGREDDAVAALARAESVMAQISADALPAKRRQELERQLWWAYMKLGVDRVEAGAQEAAMSPLFQALAFKDIGVERQEETRATLARALEEIVDARSVDIGALIEAGDTAAAAIQGDKLWSLLRAAVDQGLPQDQLTDAFAKVSALFHKMGGPEMAPQAPIV